MSNNPKETNKAENSNQSRPTRTEDYSNYVPPTPDDAEFWEDEFEDYESFEKMPRGRKKNEWS